MKTFEKPTRRWRSVALVAWLTVSSSGCQQIQSSHVATPLDAQGKPQARETTQAGIVVSGEELTDLASPLFGSIEVTFENRFTSWAHLRVTSLRFDSESVDQTVYLPAGPDLLAWTQATLRRNTIRRNNTELAFGALAAGGLVASAAFGRSRAGSVAGLVTVASLGALLYTAAGEPNACGAAPPLFPADHLFGEPISVPPGLFAKRWVVLHTPDPRRTGCLRRMQIGFQLDDGHTEYVLLTFRDIQTRSDWQSDVCNVASGGPGL